MEEMRGNIETLQTRKVQYQKYKAFVEMVEANERGKIILERMQSDIRERKAAMPKSNPNGFSGRFNNPSKSATYQQSIQKVRAEAKAARAKVPPDMRAEPYSDETFKTSKHKSGFSNSFKTARQTEPKDKSAKMGSAFNGASKASKSEPKQNPAGPETKQ